VPRPAHRGAPGRRIAPWHRGLLITGVSGLVFAGVGVVGILYAHNDHRTSSKVVSDTSTTTLARPPTPVVRPVSQLAHEDGVVVTGHLAHLPWPKAGEGAVAVKGVGLIAESRHQRVVPIASVTKVMTAYMVLSDHPLPTGAGGPVLEMTEADHLAYLEDVAYNDSSVNVAPGEKLDERQLLEALLIPSADNIADLLARWDAGSEAAFVAKMNARARALGLDSTHYADPSGLDPGDRSTAADQAKLAGLAMALPSFASIVDEGHVRLPVAGEVWGYNPALGEDGVVGVKSGFTSHSLGCLTVAAVRSVDGHKTIVISVVLGQPWGLDQAADEDKALVDAVTPALGLQSLVTSGSPVATVSVPWSGRGLAVYARTGLALVTWPGLGYSVVMRTGFLGSPWRLVVPRQPKESPGSRSGGHPPHHGSHHQGQSSHTGGAQPKTTPHWVIPRGTSVGSIEIFAAGGRIATIPLRLAQAISGPPSGWSPSRA
jgi:D-alanyl-D-alanine carboxypeptidase (penicillin-binding protein 5/6)